MPVADIFVIKRDGSKTSLDVDKIHFMVEQACEGLPGVSVSQVEINANIQFYDGITTKTIQDILIKSAADLITLESPNYQYVAARLLLFGLYKDVYGRFKPISLIDIIKKNVEKGVYSADILSQYSEAEIEKLDNYIKYQRDFELTYAGAQQIVDKYLVQDRVTKQIFETPQVMYMLIAACLFANYPLNTRLTYVRRYYDAISQHKLNIPTPIMAGVRTPIKQYSSCVLIDCDDTLNSIFSTATAAAKYTAQRAGIGLNMGRLRAINSKIRDGEVVHTGAIPFLKVMEATVRSCSQNGLRGGNATVYFPIWHQEIEDIIVLKNNKGTEDNRVRKMDYGIQLSKLFYERFLNDDMISLFSTKDVPGLYDAWGTPEFDSMYLKYEQSNTTPKKKVKAQELISKLIMERADTGRIYIQNIDHANTHSSFLDTIHMSNLCIEITLPTKPIQHIDDENGEIALCILSAINLGKINHLDDFEGLADLAVRSLDELIDIQNYPFPAAKNSTLSRRSLGIGYIGVAHYLAKHKLSYNDKKAWELMDRTTEALQYYLLKASNNLAKEKGYCSAFNRTKYSLGILPIDTYKKDVDILSPLNLQYDWEKLRRDIKQYGLRNSTLTAQMPSESSSVCSNATNGIEPPRDFLSVKKSKKGPLKQIVPQYSTLKNYYTLLWNDPDLNDGYLAICAVMQRYFDQAISVNTSYNPEHYANNEVPLSLMLEHLLNAYKFGLKSLYYHNTYDGMREDVVDVKVEKDFVTLALKDNKTYITINNQDECESCAI